MEWFDIFFSNIPKYSQTRVTIMIFIFYVITIAMYMCVVCMETHPFLLL